PMVNTDDLVHRREQLVPALHVADQRPELLRTAGDQPPNPDHVTNVTTAEVRAVKSLPRTPGRGARPAARAVIYDHGGPRRTPIGRCRPTPEECPREPVESARRRLPHRARAGRGARRTTCLATHHRDWHATRGRHVRCDLPGAP